MNVAPRTFFNAWLGAGAGILICVLFFGDRAENLMLALATVWIVIAPYIHFVVLPKARAKEGRNER